MTDEERANRSVTVRRVTYADLPQAWRGTMLVEGDGDVDIYETQTEADWIVPGACCPVGNGWNTALFYEEE